MDKKQIPLPLLWPVADRDSDFLVSEANRTAHQHLMRWSHWPVMATLLTGPRKSGRSMLGRIFARHTEGRVFDHAEAHEEEAIFHAWNDAQARRRPLLIIADAPPPAWQVALPDLRSRLAATPHVEIAEPDDALIAGLIVKLFADRGLAPPPELPDYLVPRIERSYVAVQQVVDVMDRTIMGERKRFTLTAAREALTAAGLVRRARS